MSKINLVVAPNSFKECADAIEIGSNIQNHFKEIEFRVKNIPISDGGDGFLKICKNRFKLKTIVKKNPSFYDKSFFQIPIGISKDNKKIYLESAEIIGMKKIPVEKRNPLMLNSNNLGILLLEIEKEYPVASKIILGLGGTATNDLGLGLCVPFGLKLFNKKGVELPVNPKYYAEVDSIILPEKRLSLPLEVIADVKVPLYGSVGTSKTFAKQKGAAAKGIEILEKGVKNIISILTKEHKIDFSLRQTSLVGRQVGAGGGLLLGLSLVANAQVIYAEEFFLKDLQLEKEIKKADFIITGEGSFDEQSMMNKGTGILLRLAKKYKKKIFLICGTFHPVDIFQNSHQVKVFSLEKYFKSRQTSIKNYKIGIGKACGEIKSYILSHS